MKKHLILLIGLLCIAFCSAFLLTACNGSEASDPTETVAAPTQPEQTTAPTEPEVTEPEVTEPEATEPEVTEPEATEPEATQPGSSNSGGGINHGTGGGYNPGTGDPTEPEAPTEGEILPPPAGSEENAYYEQTQESFGEFETVKIPAGQTMFYRIKTSGAYLHVADGDLSVTYDGNTYEAVEGKTEIELPADDSKVLSIQFTNNGTEEKSFAVAIKDVLGSENNPIPLDSLKNAEISLEEGDDLYYRWISDKDGELRLTVEGGVTHAVTVNGENTADVKTGDEVVIHLTAEAAANVVIDGYVAEIIVWDITEIPCQKESVNVPAGESVIYSISGAYGRTLTIADTNVAVRYEDIVYTPDESGKIDVLILADEDAMVELFNMESEDSSYLMTVSYPVGHEENPHILTALGEIDVDTTGRDTGYFLKYTAETSGYVRFLILTYPDMEDVETYLTLTNTATGESVAIGDEDNALASDGVASVWANAGDAIDVLVYVEDVEIELVETQLVILGELYGNEDSPIPVQYPGFTAEIPAGATLYYEGTNLSGLIMTLTGTDVEIAHNGSVYQSENGSIVLTVKSGDRNPAVFAITNKSENAQSFAVVFTHPIGWRENPDVLILGENTVTQEAGANDYFYKFTAPRKGTLTLTFDADAQWVYAVDNLTQGIYGDSRYSDNVPMVSETTVPVNKGDEILIRVNTYDTANFMENPAGEVVFTAKYVSGPTLLNTFGQVQLALLNGESGVFTGQFYDLTLTINNAQGMTVTYNGTVYSPNESGIIKVAFPAAPSSGSNLQFTVHNGTGADVSTNMLLTAAQVGTEGNPDYLTIGETYSIDTNGEKYYFKFTSDARYRLRITFAAGTEWTFQLTNLTTGSGSGVRTSATHSSTYTFMLNADASFELWINTYDSATGTNPDGTVTFTLEAL